MSFSPRLRRLQPVIVLLVANVASGVLGCGNDKPVVLEGAAGGRAGDGGSPGFGGQGGTRSPGAKTATGGQIWETPSQVGAHATIAGPDDFQVETKAVGSSLDLIGGAENRVFVCGCSGGQMASGCGIWDMSDTNPQLSDGALRCHGTSAWGSSDSDVYFPRSRHFDGQKWSTLQVLEDGGYSLEITGTSATNFWMRDMENLFHMKEGVGAQLPQPLPLGDVMGIQAAGDDELWAIQGDSRSTDIKGTLVRFAGDHWESTGLTEALGVSASSSSNVWAVDTTFIYRFDGTHWTQTPDPLVATGASAVPLRAIWTSGPSDTWVTGDDNLLRHWNGEQWLLLDLGDEKGVFLGKLWGTPSGLWVLRRVIPGYQTLASAGVAFKVSLPH